MSIRTCTSVLSAFILMVGAGCSSVTVREPLGTPVAPAVQDSFVGTWMWVTKPKEESLVFEIARDQKGQLWAAWLEFDKDSDAFKVKKIPLNLTQLDGVDLFFFRGNEEDENDEQAHAMPFTLHRYKVADDQSVQIYLSNFGTWRAAIEQQRLKGTFREARELFGADSIELDATAEQVAQFIKSEGVEKCFDAEPQTFKRIRWSN